jgi:nucleotidyltransferase substrate binding protein (TIGR01987 family)
VTLEQPALLDLSALQDAISSLRDGLGVVSNPIWFNQQSSPVQNTLIAGVIKNFEFVYEISIKMIRRRLEIGSDSPTDVDQMEFRNLLRSAAERGLIADVEAWFKYRKMRNITSQPYDHEKARQIYQETLVFIQDAGLLLEKLEAMNA